MIKSKFIKTLKLSIRETNTNMVSLLQPETYQAVSQFLKTRAVSVRNNINERHTKKLKNLANEYHNSNNMDKTKWVVNISSRPLTNTEVEVLQKGPKFAPPPPPHRKSHTKRLSPTSKQALKT